VTKEGSPNFVRPNERIATFDNVFIPSVPTPMTGCVSIIDNRCVYRLDVTRRFSDAVHLEVGRPQQTRGRL
jgi:uncharacterized membrane protein